jgi:hypothetical protein
MWAAYRLAWNEMSAMSSCPPGRSTRKASSTARYRSCCTPMLWIASALVTTSKLPSPNGRDVISAVCCGRAVVAAQLDRARLARSCVPRPPSWARARHRGGRRSWRGVRTGAQPKGAPVIAGAEDHHLSRAAVDSRERRVVEEHRARLYEARNSPDRSPFVPSEVDHRSASWASEKVNASSPAGSPVGVADRSSLAQASATPLAIRDGPSART